MLNHIVIQFGRAQMCFVITLTFIVMKHFSSFLPTGWTMGVLGFDSRRGLGSFLFPTGSRMTLGPTQPPIQWVPGAFSLVVKRSGREADLSPPSSVEVKECMELYLHCSSTSSWRGASVNNAYGFTACYLIKHSLLRMTFYSLPEARH